MWILALFAMTLLFVVLVPCLASGMLGLSILFIGMVWAFFNPGTFLELSSTTGSLVVKKETALVVGLCCALIVGAAIKSVLVS